MTVSQNLATLRSPAFKDIPLQDLLPSILSYLTPKDMLNFLKSININKAAHEHLLAGIKLQISSPIKYVNLKDLLSYGHATEEKQAGISFNQILKEVISLDLSQQEIDQKLFTALLKTCTNLRHISLNLGFNYGNRDRFKNAPVCPKILSLDLSANLALRGEYLLRFADRFPNLKSLDLTGCSLIQEDHLLKIAEKLTSLTHLYLSWCYFVTFEGALKLTKKLPNLKYIDLGFIFHPQDLLEKLINSLFDECPNLIGIDTGLDLILRKIEL